MSKQPFVQLSELEVTKRVEVIKAYSSSSTAYIQLAVGALIVPITFGEKLDLPLTAMALGLREDFVLILTWVSFLTCIGAGLLYQYLVVKYMASKFWIEEHRRANHFVQHPEYAYGVMLLTFYFGAVLFVLKTYIMLRGYTPSPTN